MIVKEKDGRKPKWYFVIQGRLLSVRADTRALAFSKLRAQLGMAS
jgi:hypothetical protein